MNGSALTFRSFPELVRFLFVSIWVLASLAACVRAPLRGPEFAMRRVQAPRLADDLAFEHLDAALEQQIAWFEAGHGKSVLRFGRDVVLREEYLAGLRLFRELRRKFGDTAEFFERVRANFDFYEVYGGERWGEVLVTSYFEPVLLGSRSRTERFSRPLYALPPELVKLDLAKFSERYKEERKLRGRVEGGELLPYYSREEIDVGGVLAGRGLELCWVDPIDAFFLHIQGSGSVQLEDGELLRLNYAEKNGHPYLPIGRPLKRYLAPFPVTLQSIEAYLRGLTLGEAQIWLNKNPSYVFFRRGERHALTSSGLPAVEGRTIAADAGLFPKGALAFLIFKKPVRDGNRVLMSEKTRFVFDQDSGGAITGPGRVDLFWGRGDEAKFFAGHTQGNGRLYYLKPKKVPPSFSSKG